MDLITVLQPTLRLNAALGMSGKRLLRTGVEESRHLKTYAYVFCIANLVLQVSWFGQHLYFKFVTQEAKDFQELILLFCLGCNLAVSLIPARTALANGGRLYELSHAIYRYEREVFNAKPNALKHLRNLNFVMTAVGLSVPVVFMSLELLRKWQSVSIGSHNIAVDVTAIASGFLRPCFDILYLNGFVMYSLVCGVSYASINAFLSDCATRSESSERLLARLKIVQEVDNALKDLYEEVTEHYSLFAILIVILAFLNWFYVIGFIFLDIYPRFMTPPAWVAFISVIFFAIIVGSVFARTQAERTRSLLHDAFMENDDPGILEEVEILTLQLIHRRVDVNACGFFNLDFSLLFSMIGTLTTYIVILMQFREDSSRALAKCRS